MATHANALPVNGNYHAQLGVDPNAPLHNGSETSSLAVNGDLSASATAASAHATSTEAPAQSETNSAVPKGEVGWYFVEQYYTTLSKTPDKLHLFYNKRSQFVSGVEEQKVPVCVGQRAINERIKELDYQDCKVRISNVDTQESSKSIVVQVIGEMSNKSGPTQKFVQTFILAEQPNGYFVLNDIFRFVKDEEVTENEAVEAEPEQAPAVEEEPKTLTSSNEPEAQEHDAQQLDEKLEEEIVHAEEKEVIDDTPLPNGDPAAEESEPAQVEPETVTEPDEPEEVTAEPETAPEEPATVAAEEPRDPEPTPAVSPPKQAPAVPAQAPTPAAPAKPPVPKTWANIVTANRTAPVPAAIPVATPAPSAAPMQPKAAPQQPTPPSNTASSVVNDESQNTVPPSPGAGWQTAGQENPKRQGRQQSVSGFEQKPVISGYVKNVTDRVDASILKQTLSSFGKLEYFDVSRPKNCAFVEFATYEGYQAAVNANPHVIGGEQIYVEERRPRPNAYGGGYGGRGNMRGGRGGSDGTRGGGQGRGGFKDGGRGGVVGGGRGGNGNVTPRGGRGQPVAT